MPPHLHPRSRYTSSLFATTLLASFLVVGIPHLLPCPAPRIAYADGEMNADGTRKRRRRRKCASVDEPNKETTNEAKRVGEVCVGDEEGDEDQVGEKRLRRECPVPKPPGILGEILGFKSDRSKGDNKGSP